MPITDIEQGQSLVQQVHQLHTIVTPHCPKNLYNFVLHYGIGRYGAHLPKGYRKLQDKLCFEHATKLMLRDDRFVYCEGYALKRDLGIALAHAWVLDQERDWVVLDNTWEHPVQCAYLGVPLDPQYVIQTICRTRSYGILDNWSEHWPVLQDNPEVFLHPEYAHITRDFVVADYI